MEQMKNRPLKRSEVQGFGNGTFYKHPHPNRSQKRRWAFQTAKTGNNRKRTKGRGMFAQIVNFDGKTIFHKNN